MPQNLLDYLPQDFLTRIGLPEASYPIIRITPSLLAPADPQRVVLIFCNNGGPSGVTINVDPNVSQTNGGLTLGLTLPPIILTYWDHGPIVCAPWYGVTSVITGTIAVITQSLLASAQVGNEAPVPYVVPPSKRITPVVGPLQALWQSLTGRHA